MTEQKIRRLGRRKYQEAGKKGKACRGIEGGNLRRLEGRRRDNLLRGRLALH